MADITPRDVANLGGAAAGAIGAAADALALVRAVNASYAETIKLEEQVGAQEVERAQTQQRIVGMVTEENVARRGLLDTESALLTAAKTRTVAEQTVLDITRAQAVAAREAAAAYERTGGALFPQGVGVAAQRPLAMVTPKMYADSERGAYAAEWAASERAVAAGQLGLFGGGGNNIIGGRGGDRGGGGGPFGPMFAPLNDPSRRISMGAREVGTAYQDANAALTSFDSTAVRHGYLSSEMIAAAQRGELTYREWGAQIAGTAAKFAAWTAVSIPIFAAIGAIRELASGAVESSQGIAFMQRSIDNLNTDRARQQIQALTEHFNVTIQEASTAVGIMGRIFHRQDEAVTAASAALYPVKLGGTGGGEKIDVTYAATTLTAIVNAFKLPANDLLTVFNQINQGQLRFGTSIKDSMAGLALAGGAYKTTGGNLTDLLALIVAINRQTHASGSQIGTGVAQSISMVNQPRNVNQLRALGLTEVGGNWPQLFRDAVALAQQHPEDVGAIARALGGTRQFRLFAAVLGNPERLIGPQGTLAALQPGAVRGVSETELQRQLAGAGEQIKYLGTHLQQMGAALAGSGAFAGLHLFLAFTNDILRTVTAITSEFNMLPKPLREGLVFLGEMYAIFRALKAVNIGQMITAPRYRLDAEGNPVQTGAGRVASWFGPDPQKRLAAEAKGQAQANLVAQDSEVQRAYGIQSATSARAMLAIERYGQALGVAAAQTETLTGEEIVAREALLRGLQDEAEAAVRAVAASKVGVEEQIFIRNKFANVSADMRAARTPAEVIAAAQGNRITGAMNNAATLPAGIGSGTVVNIPASVAANAELKAMMENLGLTVVALDDADKAQTASTVELTAATDTQVRAAAAAAGGSDAQAAASEAAAAATGRLTYVMTALTAETEAQTVAAASSRFGMIGGMATGFGKVGGLMSAAMIALIGPTIATMVGDEVAKVTGSKSTGSTFGTIGKDAAYGAAIGSFLGVPWLGALGGFAIGGVSSAVNQNARTERELLGRLQRQGTLTQLNQTADFASSYLAGKRVSGGMFPGGPESQIARLDVAQQGQWARLIADSQARVAAYINTPTPLRRPAGSTNPFATNPFAQGPLSNPFGAPLAGVLPPLSGSGVFFTNPLQNPVVAAALAGHVAKGGDANALAAEGAKEIAAAKTTKEKVGLLHAFSAMIDESFQAIHGGPASVKGSLLTLQQAASMGPHGAPEAFGDIYRHSANQAQIDTFLKDTIAQQGITLASRGKIGEAIAITHRESVRSLANAANPGKGGILYQQQQEQMGDAAMVRNQALIQTWLSQSGADLTNALNAATTPAQIHAAFKAAIANDRWVMKQPGGARLGAVQLRTDTLAAYTQLTQYYDQRTALANAADPAPLDVAQRNYANALKDLAAALRNHAGPSAVIQAQTGAATTYNALAQERFNQAEQRNALYVAQAGNDQALADQRTVGGLRRVIRMIHNDPKLMASDKQALILPLHTQLTQALTTKTNSRIDQAQTIIQNNTALGIALAGNDQALADQRSIAGLTHQIAALRASGLTGKALQLKLTPLQTSLVQARRTASNDMIDQTQTIIQNNAALGVAQAGNDQPLADQRAVDGIVRQIAALRASGLTGKALALKLTPLLTSLASARTQALNDAVANANAYTTALLTYYGNANNDPVAQAHAQVAIAEKILAEGHFKTPADRLIALNNLATKRQDAQSAAFQDLQTRDQLSQLGASAEIASYEGFLKTVKNNVALRNQIKLAILQLEQQNAGQFNLDVGNLTVGNWLGYGAARVRAQAQARGGSVSVTVHAPISVHGADPKATADHVTRHISTTVRSTVRAALRSSVIR